MFCYQPAETLRCNDTELERVKEWQKVKKFCLHLRFTPEMISILLVLMTNFVKVHHQNM